MTNKGLAASYLEKAGIRLKALATLRDEGGHSDVVREAQELTELVLKAMLRSVGVDPPKHHDVGELLVEHAEKFPVGTRSELARAADISKRLRKDRELAFYGDVDFIPTKEYKAEDGRRAYDDAAWLLDLARRAVGTIAG